MTTDTMNTNDEPAGQPEAGTIAEFTAYNEIPIDVLVRGFIGAEGIRGHIDNDPLYADYVKWLDGIPAYLETLPIGDLIGCMYELSRTIEEVEFKLLKATIGEKP